ncbi:MAG: hypothetical protein R2745_14335 [Vicinamibacterales bacterium]
MIHVRRVVLAILVVAAAAVAMPRVAARQAAPGDPANLTWVSNGGSLSLLWTHSTGAFTHYQLEAALAPGAPPFVVFPTSAFVDPTKLPQLLNNFGASGVGPGTYYIKVRGMNGAAASNATNEVGAVIANGCVPPGAPTNFTQIVRGTLGFLMWNPGSGGQPTAYILQASFSPNDPAPPIQVPLGTPYFTLAIPPGSYYVKIAAANACGVSAPSNELNVASPNTTPDRTPDPAPGERLPQPFVRDIVFALAAQARAAGLMDGSVSCPVRPGFDPNDIETRKVNLNPYINYMVDNLRLIDRRFGYNAKPTRANAIVAGDEIAYHYGSDAPEGSPNVYLVDTLGGHCTFGRETADYRPFYNEFGRWTAAGRFVP